DLGAEGVAARRVAQHEAAERALLADQREGEHRLQAEIAVEGARRHRPLGEVVLEGHAPLAQRLDEHRRVVPQRKLASLGVEAVRPEDDEPVALCEQDRAGGEAKERRRLRAPSRATRTGSVSRLTAAASAASPARTRAACCTFWK